MASAWLAATLTGVAAYTATATKHAHFTTLTVKSTGADCTAIEGLNVDDKWCVKNCDQETPFCPVDMCKCPGGNPIAGTNMTAPAESTTPTRSCRANKDDRNDVNDAWCMLNCNPVATGTSSGAPPNCPTKKCTCEGGNPTGNGMPAHMSPEEYQAWKENDERKKAAAEKEEKKREAEIAEEQETKKEDARSASAEAAATQQAEKEAERGRVEAEREAAAQEAQQKIHESTQQHVGSSGDSSATAEPESPRRDRQEQPAAPLAATPRPLTEAETEAQEEFNDREKDAAAARAAMEQAAEETRNAITAAHDQAENEREQAEESRLAPSGQQQGQQGQQEQAGAGHIDDLDTPKLIHSRDDGHMCGGVGAQQYPCHTDGTETERRQQ